MSRSRLALRLGAVEALCPSASLATGGPYPTAAGKRVYDSRIDQIATAKSPEELDAILDQLEAAPLLTVYTEEDSRAPYGDNKYPAREQVVTLVVEAMIAAKGVLEYDKPDGTTGTIGTLEAPITDAQHEAKLDTLESDVCRLLDPRARLPSAAAFRKVAMETRTIHSDPQRDATRTVRLATRTIKFHIKVKTECWPSVAPPAGSPPFAFLPEPLASVAGLLAPNSSGWQSCMNDAQAILPPAPIPVPAANGGIFVHAGLGFVPDGTNDSLDAQVPPAPPSS